MPLKLFLRGETWHYRGTVAGRRFRGSTKVARANKATAQEIVSRLEARIWQGSLNPGSVLTFAQAAILYRAAGKPTRFLDRVEDFWKDTPIKDISAGRIKASCVALYPAAKAATRNRAVITPTQSVINHAAEQELCQPVKVKRWPVEKVERRPVTWNWLMAFSSSCDSDRMTALAKFMFLTGARIGEAISLRWSEVDLAGCSATIRQSKTSTTRQAHLPTELVVALANLTGRDPNARVFGYADRHLAWRAWEKAVERAGIEYLHPHCCRHGFATSLLQAGVDVVTVAKLGGWRSAAQVLATYGHSSEDRTITDVLTQPGLNYERKRSRK
jgi:integrase